MVFVGKQVASFFSQVMGKLTYCFYVIIGRLNSVFAIRCVSACYRHKLTLSFYCSELA